MDEAKYKEVTDLRLDILKLQSLVEQAESKNCEIRPTITYHNGNSVIVIPEESDE